MKDSNIRTTFLVMYVLSGLIALLFAGCVSSPLSGYIQILGTALIVLVLTKCANRIASKYKLPKIPIAIGMIISLISGMALCYVVQSDHIRYWIETIFGLLVSFLFALVQ